MNGGLRERRRILVFGGGALALGLGLYLVFGDSDQKAVLAILREIGAAVSSRRAESDREHAARLRDVLARNALDSVSLNAPEVGTVEGRDEIVDLLALAEGAELTVNIEQADVRVDSTRAQATLLIAIVVRIPGEERRQIRTLSADLVRRGRGFRVSTLALSAVSREQPEARP